MVVKEDARAQAEHAAQLQDNPEAHSDDSAESWIHSLAGEWQSRWERVQNPHALSGASLRK
jgi:hypothetical protein